MSDKGILYQRYELAKQKAERERERSSAVAAAAAAACVPSPCQVHEGDTGNQSLMI